MLTATLGLCLLYPAQPDYSSGANKGLQGWVGQFQPTLLPGKPTWWIQLTAATCLAAARRVGITA